MKRLMQSWVIMLASVSLLLLAACGPAAVPSGTGDEVAVVSDDSHGGSLEADSGDVTGNGVVDSDSDGATGNVETEAVVNDNGLDVDPSSATMTAEGIEVGFTKTGHVYRGDPNAPVVIEEYSDFQCPFCSRFYEQTMPSLDEKYVLNGDAVIIYKDFPLESIHPQARLAALAARCAGEVGGAVAYWGMHDILFERMRDWGNAGAATQLVAYANELGVDGTAVEQCMNEGRYNQDISFDLQVGSSLGVRGTPAFFINGSLLSGAQPIQAFDTAIGRALAGEEAVAQAPPATNNNAGTNNTPPPAQPVVAPTPASFGDEAAATKGDPDAPVTIVEFTDYQCPFCARHSSDTMPSIVANMIDTGDVYYILKDLPLDNLHPQARQAAVAARCAGEQEGYWGMHDALFAEQATWSNKDEATVAKVLSDMAGELDLDMDAFATCYESGRYDQAIQDNANEARTLQVGSTPSFFIDGYPLNGARPYENFVTIVGLAKEGALGEAFAEALRQRQAQEAAAAAQEAQNQPPPQPTGPVDVKIGTEPAFGDPNAPVTIVEYTDFQCPFCQRHSANTLPAILENYVATGQVYYVIKDFPLESIHPQAFLASEAARCAFDQGEEAYLGVHDLIFNNQRAWSNAGAADVFVGYASQLGLDTTAFQSCLESHKYLAAVRTSLNEGIEDGVRGTPSFFINGQFVSGAQPLAVFQGIIDGQVTE